MVQAIQLAEIEQCWGYGIWGNNLLQYRIIKAVEIKSCLPPNPVFCQFFPRASCLHSYCFTKWDLDRVSFQVPKNSLSQIWELLVHHITLKACRAQESGCLCDYQVIPHFQTHSEQFSSSQSLHNSFFPSISWIQSELNTRNLLLTV